MSAWRSRTRGSRPVARQGRVEIENGASSATRARPPPSDTSIDEIFAPELE
jgi:hypothetical protein